MTGPVPDKKKKKKKLLAGLNRASANVISDAFASDMAKRFGGV